MTQTLTALTFRTEDGAHSALDTMKDLSTRSVVKLHDAVVLWWPAGAARPRTQQLSDVVSPFTVGGSVAGLVMGVLFTVPLFGAAAGAAAGLVAGRSMRALSDLGVDRDFIASVRDQVTPGTSALFLLTSDADMDAVAEAFRGTEMHLAATDLSDEQARELRTLLELDDG